MSRSTQWIGLTKRAEDYVAQLAPFPSDEHTSGMFDELLPLRKWAAPLDLERATYVREVVQSTPWSGGPMIFTKLVIDYQHGDQVFTNSCFQWIDDPTVKHEFIRESGRFWV